MDPSTLNPGEIILEIRVLSLSGVLQTLTKKDRLILQSYTL